MSSTFDRMQREFHDKEYRHAYADGFLNSKIATQLKVLREQRGMTQTELAKATGMQQARISVLEDVNYSSWSIGTLRRMAKAFDLRLDVEFKEFGTLVPELTGLNRKSLERHSFDDDPVFRPSDTTRERKNNDAKSVPQTIIASSIITSDSPLKLGPPSLIIHNMNGGFDASIQKDSMFTGSNTTTLITLKAEPDRTNPLDKDQQSAA